MNSIRLKICGVQSVAEARLLLECGIDFVGLNFIPSSVRCLSFETAIEIMEVFKRSSIKTVLLFKDQPLKFVTTYNCQLEADYVQLNGDESSEYAKMIDLPVMRSIAVQTSSSFDTLQKLMTDSSADFFVLDRSIQGQGDLVSLDLTGQAIASQPNKIFLAGGLMPANLQQTVSQVRPYGIDIASGVRTDGLLDRQKIIDCLTILSGMSES